VAAIQPAHHLAQSAVPAFLDTDESARKNCLPRHIQEQARRCVDGRPRSADNLRRRAEYRSAPCARLAVSLGGRGAFVRLRRL